MKTDCEIIRDILPLYCDGVCSEPSRAAVEEHLKDCADCKAELDGMSTALDIKELSVDEKNAVTAAASAWKKGKRRAFLVGGVIALLIIAIAVGGFFAYHRFTTSDGGDMNALAAAASDYLNSDRLVVDKIAERDDYLAVLLKDDADESARYMCLFERDSVFKSRWMASGGTTASDGSAISSYNMGDSNGNAVLVYFGENTTDGEKYYMFENRNTIYIRQLDPGSFVDIFVVPAESDISSTPTMVDRDKVKIQTENQQSLYITVDF